MDSVEPMQVDEDGTLSQSNDFIIDNPNFDLDQYANSFQGLAKIRRLMFIAKHCPTLRADALRYKTKPPWASKRTNACLYNHSAHTLPLKYRN